MPIDAEPRRRANAEGITQPTAAFPVGMERGLPHVRASLDPARSVPAEQVMSRPDYTVQETDLGPLAGLTGQGQPLASSPPPSNPEEATELQRLRSEMAELKQALGAQRKESKRELEEQKLAYELAQAAGRSGFATPNLQEILSRLPPGVNLEETLKVKDFMTLLFTQVVPQTYAAAQAGAVRSMWEVSPEEEAAAMQRFPVLANYAEPERTRQILRVARFLRQEREGLAPAVAPDPASNGARQVRAAAPTVPQPEASFAPVQMTEQSGVSGVDRARAAYTKAEQLPATSDAERRAKMRAMREAHDAYLQAQGMTEDAMRHTGFQHKA